MGKKKDQITEPDPSVEPDEVCCEEVDEPDGGHEEYVASMAEGKKPFDQLAEEADKDPLGKLVSGPGVIMQLGGSVRVADCDYSCTVDGVRYRECPVHGRVEVQGTCRCGHPETAGVVHSMVSPCFVATVERKPITYPYHNEGVLVLGPDVFLSTDGRVITWKGQDYYAGEGPTEKAQPMTEAEIHQAKAAAVAEEGQWRKRHLPENAMQWAVALHTPQGSTSEEVVKTAGVILDWMTEND